MATLRLFASVREAAGVSSTEIDAGTVGEVIEIASETYGEGFRSLLGSCRVWVNGEPADDADPVGPDDEVALLPPVSGGQVPHVGPSAGPPLGRPPRSTGR